MDEDPAPSDEPGTVSAWALDEPSSVEPGGSSTYASGGATYAPPADIGSAKAERAPLLYTGPAPSAPPAAFEAPRAKGPEVTPSDASGHCVSVVLLNVATIVLLIACGAARADLRTTFGAAAGGCYALYIIATLCSPRVHALHNSVDQAQLDAIVRKLRLTRPVIVATSVSWHYETRTRTVTTTDSDGRHYHSEEEYTVRVTSHTAKQAFAFRWCRDVSGPPVYQPHVRSLRVRFRTVIDFASWEAKQAYEAWKAGFFAAHNRDDYQETSLDVDIPGLPAQLLLQQTGGEGAGCVSPSWHVLATILLLGGAFEICVLQAVPQVRWKLVKQIDV